MSDLRYWLALNSLSEVGNILARRLLSFFGDPENIFNMPVSELSKIENIGYVRARSIAGFKQWDRIENEINSVKKSNARLITIADGSYPEGLKHIPDAPLVLYVRGEIKDEDKYAIAIVGSRRSTDYGYRTAEKLSCKIAAYGLTVVSGMARGIDTAAHRGALKSGGRTIAVLGSGIDVPYPPENKKIMSLIASSGAVISEFPPGTPPNRENFPKRNRIISAMALGVTVIEATVDSGSLITVGYALEQGKDVFAVPGNITSKTSRGTNELIKNGAKLVESAEEIIDELSPQIKGFLKEEKLTIEEQIPSMTEEEKKLYNYLDSEPKHIDKIVRESNISTAGALSILLNLELKGAVKQTGGKRFYID